MHEACSAVAERVQTLPAGSFVDPELRRKPRALVRSALILMEREWNILEATAGRYRLADRRRHPQFPLVEDIVAYQVRFLEETLANVAVARDRVL